MGRRFSFRVNKSTVKLRLRFLGLHFFGMLSKHPNVDTVGMSNLCTDGRFVPFIDYDNVFLYRVVNEVRKLQRRWKVGTVAVLSTGEDIDMQGKHYGNYHVVAYSKFKFFEILKMLDETSCDPNFRRIPEFFNGRYWVLRICPKYLDGREIRGKPYLRRVLYARAGRELSYPHFKFLCNVYQMPKPEKRFNGCFDRAKTLKTVVYQTTEGGWLPKSISIKNLIPNKFK